MFDESADGRELSRPNQNSNAVSTAAKRLSVLVPARKDEFDALATHIDAGGAAPLSGNRYFWRSDFMTHPRAALYVSVKMSSSRTVGTESINGKNLLGYWLPFGLTYIAPDGDEYTNVYPLWDWGRLPGVTSPHFAALPDTLKHASSRVGGVSDGDNGLAAMHLDRANTTAEKAWFALGELVVALGAQLSSTHAEPVGTTLAQRLLSGAVTSNLGAAAAGTSTLKGVTWLHHDKVGFLFFEPTTLQLQTGPATGNWQTLSAAQKSTPACADRFLAYLEHGASPKAASYAYAIAPAAAPTALSALASKLPVTLLSNDAKVQAIRHDALGVTGFMFHQAGKLQTGSFVVTVDQPALLLLSQKQSRVTAASVDAAAATLKVTVAPVSGTSQTVQLNLPGEPALAGSSVSTMLADLGVGGVGTGGSGGGEAPGAVAGNNAGGGDSAASGAGSDNGGCGCRTAPNRPAGAFTLLLGGVALLLARRRNRARNAL